MKKQLLEEQFFIWYHFQTPPWQTNLLTPLDRKWFIDRFVRQKEKENEFIVKQKHKRKK